MPDTHTHTHTHTHAHTPTLPRSVSALAFRTYLDRGCSSGPRIWCPESLPGFGFARPAGARPNSSRDAALSPCDVPKSREKNGNEAASGRGGSGKCSPTPGRLWLPARTLGDLVHQLPAGFVDPTAATTSKRQLPRPGDFWESPPALIAQAWDALGSSFWGEDCAAVEWSLPVRTKWDRQIGQVQGISLSVRLTRDPVCPFGAGEYVRDIARYFRVD